jgi:hypothetical protein
VKNESNKITIELAIWITNITKIIEIDSQIAFRAGELRKILNILLIVTL